jgi:hypothetical protein
MFTFAIASILVVTLVILADLIQEECDDAVRELAI